MLSRLTASNPIDELFADIVYKAATSAFSSNHGPLTDPKDVLVQALMDCLTSSAYATSLCSARGCFAHGWEGLEGVRDILLDANPYMTSVLHVLSLWEG